MCRRWTPLILVSVLLLQGGYSNGQQVDGPDIRYAELIEVEGNFTTIPWIAAPKSLCQPLPRNSSNQQYRNHWSITCASCRLKYSSSTQFISRKFKESLVCSNIPNSWTLSRFRWPWRTIGMSWFASLEELPMRTIIRSPRGRSFPASITTTSESAN